MKALILSCNTGQGHNSCAEAIEEYFEERGAKCLRADALSFISGGVSSLISKGHVFLYRHLPGLYRRGYEFSEEHEELMGKKAPIYALMLEGIGKLYDYIVREGVDTVICPHIFPAIMVTELMARRHIKLKTAFIGTDYTCSPGTGESALDYYFMADTSEPMPMPQEKIIPCPIPVRREFYSRLSRSEAGKRLGIGEDKKHLIVMCGSMGCGPLRRICFHLKREMPSDAVISVICGTNRRLRLWLRLFYGRDRRFRILGYTEDMPLMMDSAQLYLTKPGGLSTSEAGVKGLPMVLINAVPGCEKYNLRYMLSHGLARTAEGPEALAGLCAELIEDSESLDNMRRAAEGLFKENAAEIIYNVLSGEGKKDENEA